MNLTYKQSTKSLKVNQWFICLFNKYNIAYVILHCIQTYLKTIRLLIFINYLIIIRFIQNLYTTYRPTQRYIRFLYNLYNFSRKHLLPVTIGFRMVSFPKYSGIVVMYSVTSTTRKVLRRYQSSIWVSSHQGGLNTGSLVFLLKAQLRLSKIKFPYFLQFIPSVCKLKLNLRKSSIKYLPIQQNSIVAFGIVIRTKVCEIDYMNLEKEQQEDSPTSSMGCEWCSTMYLH